MTRGPATGRDKPAGGTRLRRLSAEEIDLWLGVAATVVRRPGAILPVTIARPDPIAPEIAPAAAPQPVPITAERSRPLPLAALDRKIRQKLSRGRMSADAAIDLHGLRQAEAHAALRHFLHQAQAGGARIVLVVTGKGGRGGDPFDLSGGNIGVLKRTVPLWLSSPEFRPLVLGFEDAARPHGGTGALYVRVRRRERP